MKFFHLSLFFLVFSLSILAQENIVISGYIEDNDSGERLIGATIFEKNSKLGAVSNSYGFFSLNVSEGFVELEIAYLGYQEVKREFGLRFDTTVVFSLKKVDQYIQEVAIKAERNIYKWDQGNHLQLSSTQVEKIPAILGEKDVLKAYQLMPGVQGGIEGTAGMIVRGSDPGQNLVLLDGIPVYNVNHLFGLFSIFNNDAVKSSTLIKGAFPARYGGRVASVLDVRMKEGNNKQLKGSASIGLISSKILVEGPIKKDTTSFLFTVRRTYIDLFAYPYFTWILKDEGNWTYNFHDLNLKLNHRINESNRVYLSYYNGRDKYGFNYRAETMNWEEDTYFTQEEQNGFNWGNNTATLRWNSYLNKRFFCNTTVLYSRYKFLTHNSYEEIVSGNENLNSEFQSEFYSGISDYGGTIDFDYRLNKNHQLLFGATFTKHRFKPGVSVFDFNDFGGLLSIDSTDTGEVLINNEAALYIEDGFLIGKKLDLNIGLRYSAFIISDKVYSHFEPRGSVRFQPAKNHVLDMAYSRTTQSIHLLVNSSVGFPTDQWVPVTDKVKPVIADQFNISYLYKINRSWTLTVSSFYKTMQNILDYEENADKKLNWQEIVEQGQGAAKGLELLLEKKQGRTTGWLAYTLSKSDRTFENINGGKSFPYKYDRRHDFKIVLMHRFNNKTDLTANWIFNTGHAITLPLEVYAMDYSHASFSQYSYGSEITNYNYKNDFRMPNYHRLDVAVNFHKKKERLNRTITLGIYNLYMHHNALYYDFYNGKLRSHSVIPIMPSVSYSIQF